MKSLNRNELNNGACANYVMVPGFHGMEDAQIGWVAGGNWQSKRRLGTLEEEERRSSFHCQQRWVRFFFFVLRWWTRVVFMGVAAVHIRKKNMASHFIRLPKDPNLLCPIDMNSGSPKSFRVCGAHFSLWQRAAPLGLPSNPAKINLRPYIYRTGVLYNLRREALRHAQWVAQSTQ